MLKRRLRVFANNMGRVMQILGNGPMMVAMKA
jgi:hypothetical protein